MSHCRCVAGERNPTACQRSAYSRIVGSRLASQPPRAEVATVVPEAVHSHLATFRPQRRIGSSVTW